MTIKCSMVFTYKSNQGRAGGWTESWYRQGNLADAVFPFDSVAKKRAVMLPVSISITQARFQEIGGRSLVIKTNIPGIVDGVNVQDIPQMAALVAMQGQGINNIKRFWLRGLPDGWVVGGDISPAVGFPAQLKLFTDSLASNAMQMRYQLQTAASAMVASIDAQGNVTTLANMAVAVNNIVQVLRMRDANGKPVRGTFPVASVTDALHFKLANWTGQVVNVSGRVRLQNLLYATVDASTVAVLLAGPRKIGRPFASYRGRRSKRR